MDGEAAAVRRGTLLFSDKDAVLVDAITAMSPSGKAVDR